MAYFYWPHSIGSILLKFFLLFDCSRCYSHHSSKPKTAITAIKEQRRKTKPSIASNFPELGGEKGDETDGDDEEDDGEGEGEGKDAAQDSKHRKEVEDGENGSGNAEDEGGNEGDHEKDHDDKDDDDNGDIISKKSLSTVNLEALKGYLNAGNYISAIFRKCVQLEDPTIYSAFSEHVIQQIRDVAFGAGCEEPPSITFTEEDSELLSKRVTFRRLMDQFENNIFILKEKPRDEKNNTFYMSDRDLQEFGISKVVHDFMFKPSKIM